MKQMAKEYKTQTLRPVAIIGVGATPYRDGNEESEIQYLTEGELFGYAAKEAMEDAGVDASQIDFFWHGAVHPTLTSFYVTPAIHMQDWVGMRGKGCAHHSEGCATGYIGLDLAVQLVGSGKYNMVLTGAIEQATQMYDGEKPAHMRKNFSMDMMMGFLMTIYDRAYGRPNGAAPVTGFDDPMAEYMLKYDVTPEQLDAALNGMTKNNRRAAVLNERAIKRTPFEEEAAACGFDSVDEYLASPFNPKMSDYLRVNGTEARANGAAACIVCPLEDAWKYTDKPIVVLGSANRARESMQPHLERKCTEEAAAMVYEITGKTPEDIDILYANDFVIESQLTSAEAVGYLPKGEGWKYFIDGTTAFDGDKPMNTNGGRTSFGHAHGASGLQDVYEAVKQLRGECGPRQVKNDPKTVFLRGFGGAQNVICTILEKAEKED